MYDEMRRKEEEIKQNFVAKVREKEVALKYLTAGIVYLIVQGHGRAVEQKTADYVG